MAAKDPFKTGATAGMTREAALYALCRCHSCPSTSKCNLLQNSKALLAQEDTGLSLTHLRNWTGAQHPSTAITLACALLTLLVSSVFLSGVPLHFLRTLTAHYNKNLQALAQCIGFVVCAIMLGETKQVMPNKATKNFKQPSFAYCQ